MVESYQDGAGIPLKQAIELRSTKKPLKLKKLS